MTNDIFNPQASQFPPHTNLTFGTPTQLSKAAETYWTSRAYAELASIQARPETVPTANEGAPESTGYMPLNDFPLETTGGMSWGDFGPQPTWDSNDPLPVPEEDLVWDKFLAQGGAYNGTV
jgi:hypothetical protein